MLPKILLTSGDPNGIGPEIILKIFGDSGLAGFYSFKIAGDKRLFDEYSRLLGFRKIPAGSFEEVRSPNGFQIRPGSVDKLSGKHAGDCIKLAAGLCLKGRYDAMVTLPVSKEALNLGGHNFPGHTEMLTSLTGSKSSLMMMTSKRLKVCLVTNHLPLGKASKALTSKAIVTKAIIANNSLIADFGLKNPAIAVLSLNPHAGDGGLTGSEEEEIIGPSISGLKLAGMNVSGPFASDAFFAQSTFRKYDLTIAMYHDQGLIPFKMLAGYEGVNFTAGLPIVRTSPDHGTAFNIAGLGIAETTSTINAVKTAAVVSANRKRG